MKFAIVALIANASAIQFSKVDGIMSQARQTVRQRVSAELREYLQTEEDIHNDEFVMWHQAPDFGELDAHVVYREADGGNGFKAGGWTNPLGWSDTGADDDQVVVQTNYEESGFNTPADNGLGDELVVNYLQTNSKLRYDVAEGPTKADNGESDEGVIDRESWNFAGDGTHQSKESGWTNPLSWSDDGEGDDRVLQREITNVDDAQYKFDNGFQPVKKF